MSDLFTQMMTQKFMDSALPLIGEKVLKSPAYEEAKRKLVEADAYARWAHNSVGQKYEEALNAVFQMFSENGMEAIVEDLRQAAEAKRADATKINEVRQAVPVSTDLEESYRTGDPMVGGGSVSSAGTSGVKKDAEHPASHSPFDPWAKPGG